jgi:uncharacterized damage-inducible protein DinB
MEDYLKKLFEYNDWANKRVLELLQKEKVDDEKIFTLMSHVLAAELLWLKRIVPSDQMYEIWKMYTLEELFNMQQISSNNWLAFIRSSHSFTNNIAYKNTKGQNYVSEVSSILIHVVNHATYHRGQIAMLLRQKGIVPVDTDFIIYERTITKQI